MLYNIASGLSTTSEVSRPRTAKKRDLALLSSLLPHLRVSVRRCDVDVAARSNIVCDGRWSQQVLALALALALTPLLKASVLWDVPGWTIYDWSNSIAGPRDHSLLDNKRRPLRPLCLTTDLVGFEYLGPRVI
mgnify:CR=1 FL=1